MTLDQAKLRWRVGISDLDGRSWGAGMLLDSTHVLTCAHVVRYACGTADQAALPAGSVQVRFTGAPDTRPLRATPIQDYWAPPDEQDERGDVAVLELASPVPLPGAPLRRDELTLRQPVRAFGFPDNADHGIWADATIGGDGGPGGEWVQLNPLAPSVAMTHGFSGAAVLDEESGVVVGMVVGEWKLGAYHASFMIPVETLLGHCPGLARWVPGEPAVDKGFAERADSGASGRAATRDLAAWLAGAGPGEVKVSRGEQGALGLAVSTADRERSRAIDRLRTDSAKDSLPPVGSVQLAVDATARTEDDVRRRIHDRLGIEFDGDRAHTARRSVSRPKTLVVDGIDDARDPDRLTREVLAPLIEQAGPLCLRMILALRNPDSPVCYDLESIVDKMRWDRAGRLARIAPLLDGFAEDERATRDRAAKYTGTRAHHDRADRLTVAMRQLRKAEADGDHDWVRRKLGAFECAVHREIEALRRENAELDRHTDSRDELRGRLDVARVRAREGNVIEDPQLDEMYLAAWHALWIGPCDLTLAKGLVATYEAEVRRRVE